MSATQKLRDMIDDLSWGGVRYVDLNAELDRLEAALGLPRTEPSEDGTDTPEQAAAFHEHERNAKFQLTDDDQPA